MIYTDPLHHTLISPLRVLWQSAGVKNAELLLHHGELQAYAIAPKACHMAPGAGLLLDFGRELAGGIRIVCGRSTTGIKRLRVRFGESASEAMNTPDNDHALHDTTLDVPSHGMVCYGRTGFRFLRLDLDSQTPEELLLLGLFAESVRHAIPRAGSFTCSDPQLNQIWETAVYTVDLNMQDYLYDGIKRDRQVWMGDLHPEIRVVLAAYDHVAIIPRSLDFVRDRTPLPAFMNDISSYSLWWVINQDELWLWRGDRAYLEAQRAYLIPLLHQLAADVAESGAERLTGRRFLDWPSNGDDRAIHAGLHGLMTWMFRSGARLCEALGDTATADLCRQRHAAMLGYLPDGGASKPAAAMLTLAGVADRSDVLLRDPLAGVSTFYGYYMLMAQPVPQALDLIRQYWGAMLDFGATTFWEDFDLAWTKNAGRIDELPQPGKADLHADFGRFCYTGLRHSFCHGWAAGPAAYLSEYVLGVRPAAPGFQEVVIAPNLGDLDFATGVVPTPLGPIHVEATGNTVRYQVPDGVRVVESPAQALQTTS